MSLLGRLEDLPLSDILQIIYLSRRSGRLEIRNSTGEFTVLFRNGLIAGISSSSGQDLTAYLVSVGAISDHSLHLLREAERAGIPLVTAVLEWKLLTSDALSKLIEERIAALLAPLIASKNGEFNFILNDKSHTSQQHDTEVLIGLEGFPPERFIGTGDRMKPLRGLEESVRMGREQHRRAPGASDEERGSKVPGADPSTRARPARGASIPTTTSRFAVDSSSASSMHSDPVAEKVVLFEPEPRLRVALKRTFAARGIEVLQFHASEEAKVAVHELLNGKTFFITVLDGSELGPRGVEISRLLRMIKESNRFLPVVVIHATDETEVADRLLEPEVELRLLSPMIRPGEPISEDSVEEFVEEVVEFAEEALSDWAAFVKQHENSAVAGRELYRIADEETITRRIALLESLIGELSESHDLESVAMTLLRVGAEYVDRGVLFVPEDGELVAIAGFGTTGSGEAMYRRVKGARFAQSEPSVLTEVLKGGSHHGKLRRTPANEALIGTMGDAHPTEVIVLPLKSDERIIGLFYGDNAEHHGMIGEAKGLELFFASAGRALESALIQSRT